MIRPSLTPVGFVFVVVGVLVAAAPIGAIQPPRHVPTERSPAELTLEPVPGSCPSSWRFAGYALSACGDGLRLEKGDASIPTPARDARRITGARAFIEVKRTLLLLEVGEGDARALEIYAVTDAAMTRLGEIAVVPLTDAQTLLASVRYAAQNGVTELRFAQDVARVDRSGERRGWSEPLIRVDAKGVRVLERLDRKGAR